MDIYGDRVQAAVLLGDHWRTRHDGLKMTLFHLCKWGGVPVRCEVFNMFSSCIPQEGLSRLEKGRKRQGLVPDFQLQLPSGRGVTESVLAELKVISSCPTRYNPRHQVRAVDKRASELTKEYGRKARTVDRVFGGVPEGLVGLVERKLQNF